MLTAVRTVRTAMLASALAAAALALSASSVRAATANDRVPATVQSCTSHATTGRNTLPFDCSETATKWVIGTAPTLSCYSGASVPVCGANQDFSCNSGTCVCKSTHTMCAATSTCVLTLACPPGQTFNACTNACTGNAYLSGNGTVNTVPKFVTSSSIGDSLISDNGTLVTIGGPVAAAADTDTTFTFGRQLFGCTGITDTACFAHRDRNTATSYGLLQTAAGATQVNAATGQTVTVSINDADKLIVNASGDILNVLNADDFSSGISFGGKLGVSSDATWLRLNQSSEFTSGVYTPGDLRVDGRILLNDPLDADLGTANSGMLMLGQSGSLNIVIDNNEIMARNNGSAATLTIQNQGGVTSFGGSIEAEKDLNVASYLGRAALGYCGHSDYACFSHLDSNLSGEYALLQSPDGYTYLNAASGKSINFRINNGDVARIDAAGISNWGGMWVGGDVDLSSSLSVGSGYIDSWGLDRLSLFNDRAEDGNYEYVEFRSGPGSRAGIMIWDGAYDGCASTSALCFKSEDGNNLNLKAAGGTVGVLSNLNVTGTIASNGWHAQRTYTRYGTGLVEGDELVYVDPVAGVVATGDSKYLVVMQGQEINNDGNNSYFSNGCHLYLDGSNRWHIYYRTEVGNGQWGRITCYVGIYKYR